MYWEPGTYYAEGSVVEFEGHRYKIIQAHTSQSDWAPPVTPALWGRLSDGDHGEQQHHHGHHDSEKQHHFVPEGQGNRPEGQTVEVHHEERKKEWYDLDDHRKKGTGHCFAISVDNVLLIELELGGGLLAGAALLAGGYAAWRGHEKHEEEKKATTWALQNWLHEAEARTAKFRQYGPQSPATWVLNHGKEIPQGAIAVGQEKTWTLYICRAFYEGGIQVGKASDAFQKGAVIGYKHEEVHLGTYEILLGDMNGLRWVDAHGSLNVESLGYTPVEGGRESDGTPLYIAEAPHNGAVHPGKASAKLDGAYIPYDGKEKCVKDYRVLCYNA